VKRLWGLVSGQLQTEALCHHVLITGIHFKGQAAKAEADTQLFTLSHIQAALRSSCTLPGLLPS
jgi:hypothetical protein